MLSYFHNLKKNGINNEKISFQKVDSSREFNNEIHCFDDL